MTHAVPDRRTFLQACTELGLGATLLPGVLWMSVSRGAEITTATVAAAEEIAGLSFDEEQRKLLVDRLKQQGKNLEQLHALPLDNAVAPALVFVPDVPPRAPAAVRTRRVTPAALAARPADPEQLAFLPVAELSNLVRRRLVSARELAELSLDRLKRLDPRLQCVVSLTEERARKQADLLDAELKHGRWRGPLHGMPWGAKDLLATKGYRTTWGAQPFKEQVIDADATVVQRLDTAGAVLVAKLTLGELAQGDSWFGGVTKNPWKLDQGSSGSSAGPASATAAGCVSFAIGSETLGSISSPSTRCGATGLRPTFGRVPRTGAMALSWSMDKLGPIARSVEDCALVFDAIRGTDGLDLTVRDFPFSWDATRGLEGIRVGYFHEAFDLPVTDPKDEKKTLHATKPFDDAALDVLRKLGVRLVPVKIPDGAYDAMRLILLAEAGAAFDELTRSGRDKELKNQGPFDWPGTFRTSRFIPAVDYINANRARTLAIQAWNRLFAQVDVIVTPTQYDGVSQLVATNLTGHPAVILPNGFRADGTPVSLTFLAGLFDETRLLAVAHAYQRATTFHLKHPELKA